MTMRNLNLSKALVTKIQQKQRNKYLKNYSKSNKKNKINRKKMNCKNFKALKMNNKK